MYFTQELSDFLWEKGADEIEQRRGTKLSELSARRGTYTTHGEKQPCIKVYLDKSDKKTYFRFAPLYRCFGKTTVYVAEIVDGEWNSEEELGFEWDDFSDNLSDVKKFTLYSFA